VKGAVIIGLLCLCLSGCGWIDDELSGWTGKSRASAAARPVRAEVSVRVQKQTPELFNGCEVTALSMLLEQAGKPVSKLELAREVAKDVTPEVRDAEGRTLSWGDPDRGFVGDVTGRERGYAVYHGPIADLLDRYLPGRAVDLTGEGFGTLLDAVAEGRGVVVWTTAGFGPPGRYVTWQGPCGSVRATFDEHSVLLIGYEATAVTLADPLDGTLKKVPWLTFLGGWEALGRQAVTYR